MMVARASDRLVRRARRQNPASPARWRTTPCSAFLDDQADRLGRHHDAAREGTSCSTIPLRNTFRNFRDRSRRRKQRQARTRTAQAADHDPGPVAAYLRHRLRAYRQRLVQQLYQQSRVRSRKISNAEHARWSRACRCWPARRRMELQRSTDILAASSKSSPAKPSARPDRAHPRAAADGETAFHTGLRMPIGWPTVPGRSLEAARKLALTCWKRRVMESGGAPGLHHYDYRAFCQMLLNARLDGTHHRPQDLQTDGVQYLDPSVKLDPIWCRRSQASASALRCEP